MKLIYAEKVSPEFCEGLIAMCTRLGIPDPDWLMACMEFESGLNPACKAKNSSATGLIQFMEATARGMDTTTAALAIMTDVQQLPYIERYFRPYHGRMKSLEDVYMAILWPRGIGKPLDYVLFANNQESARQYAGNKGLDFNKDGQVAKFEAAAMPRALWKRGVAARDKNTGNPT